MTENKVYYSKLLLFGEYSVICDSMGLTVPLNLFEASWKFHELPDNSTVETALNEDLRGFYAYLRKLRESNQLLAELDLVRFENDLNQGLFFDSSIPQGFGVGSSGALCAATFERYQKNKVTLASDAGDGFQRLKKALAQMESYFHGVSSGLDPLLCYLQKPLLIKNKTSIDFVDLPPDLHFPGFSIFLIDTGVVGKTGPLVNRFFEECRKYNYYKRIVTELIPANNRCIEALVANDVELLFNTLPSLSLFFFDHFKAMIPNAFHSHWKHGLDSGDYFLKLCGSGGGGFLLGFTRNHQVTQKYFSDQDISLIHL
ncbi:MAG: mevalonate kinase [Bacteroidetes bacterium]|nr:mevalonate kinase [Bacteroidota bacterium]